MGSFALSWERIEKGVAAAIALAALVLAGCEAEPNYPPLVQEEWPFRIYSYEPVPACAMRNSQAHYARWSGHLGVELDLDEFVDILVHSQSYASSYCSQGGLSAVACAPGRSVVTSLAYDPHELVHSYDSEHPQGLRFFQEGLATLGECGGLDDTMRPEFTIDPRDIIRSTDFTTVQQEGPSPYPVAANFVGFLVDRLGWPAVMEVRRAIARDADRASIDRSFEQIIDLSFEELVQQWEAAPKLNEVELCQLVLPTPEPFLLGVEAPAECVPPNYGRFGALPDGAEGPYTLLGFEGRFVITERSRVTVKLRNSHGIWTQLIDALTGESRTDIPNREDSDEVEFIVLDPGDYTLRAWEAPTFPSEGEESLHYMVDATPMPADRCAVAPIDLTPASGFLLSEFRPQPPVGDGIDVVVPLTVEAAERVEVVVLPAEAPAWLCENDCQAGPPCLPLTPFPDDFLSYSLGEFDLMAGSVYRVVVGRPDASTSIAVSADIITP